MTVLVVVFSEVLPKTAAFNAPDRIALVGGAADAAASSGCSGRC